MHWVLLLGGEASWASARLVNPASFEQCAPQQLRGTINECMETLYSVPNGPDTPLPHLSTWVLGFQVQDQHIIEEKVLPLMKGRMERMKISLKHETFYEDEPEGFTKFNLLSREKCTGLIQSVADHLLDSRIENEIVLYEFSDRPKGFPKPNLAEVSGLYGVLFENTEYRNLFFFAAAATSSSRNSGPFYCN